MKKVWKIISVVLAMVLLLSIGAFAADDESTAKIIADKVQATAGETVKVEIKAENNPGIALARIQVSYDGKLFELVNVEDGGIWGEQVHSPTYENNPYILFWENSLVTENIKENGVIATLEFKVDDGVNSGSYPIVISYDYENDDIITNNADRVKFETVNGAIVISGASNSEPEYTEERENARDERKKDVIALKINESMAYTFGKTASIDPDNSKVVPYIKNNRTLVPLRFVSETLGATVSWEEGWNYCYVVKGDTKIKITFNSADIEVNGEVTTYEAPVEVVEDRTMVPIRFISEELGYDVQWNQANQLVIITPADNAWNAEAQAEKDVLEGILVTYLFGGMY